MSAQTYIAFNAVMPTTAGIVKVATGATIKTLVQVATPATTAIRVIEWGICFDASAAAVPVLVELIQTDVAATGGTSLTPTQHNEPLGAASLCVGGAALTCFSPTGEGTITVTRVLDGQLVAPTNQYVKQFPLGREPEVPVSKFLRVRVTAPATVNALCYIIWEE
jgi:hypothetical protein